MPKPKGQSTAAGAGGIGGKSSGGGGDTARSMNAASPCSASLLYSITHQPHIGYNLKGAVSHHHIEPLKVIHPSQDENSPALVNQIKSELKDKILITRERFN